MNIMSEDWNLSEIIALAGREKKVFIPYGERLLAVDIPGELLFDGSMKETAPCDVARATEAALAGLIGSPPLSELAAGAERVVILIDDYTRRTPVRELLPPLAAALNECGIRDGQIELLVATGTHRVMTPHEIEAKVGSSRFPVFCHDAEDLSSLLRIGTLSVSDFTVPLEISARAFSADLLIGMGAIAPHPDAGYSGGAKIVAPGVCGYAANAAIHLAAGLLPVIPLGQADTAARRGIEEVGRAAKLALIINTVPDMNERTTAVVAGDPVKAHRAGVAIARENFLVAMPRRADVVLVGGYPCKADFWQASKALAAGSFAVRDGGVLILAAPCPEGLAPSHPLLEEWLLKTNDEVSAEVLSADLTARDFDFVAADVALNVTRIRERVTVFLISEGLSAGDAARLGFEKFADLDSALAAAAALIPGASYGALPMGGVALPQTR